MRLIVGLPVALDGTPHAMTARCTRFANQLRGRFAMPVDYADERLSSAEAEERLRESCNARGAKEYLDAVAAQVILQSYFQRNSQKPYGLLLPCLYRLCLTPKRNVSRLREMIRPRLQPNTMLVGIHSGGACCP